jgi:ubiquinone biosynthesis protein COQ9
MDDKYRKAIKLRLSYEIPVLNTWSQAMNLGLQPVNLVTTVDRLLKTVDILSSLEQDATKIKRYIVIKTFIASGKYCINKELHMLTDRSHNFDSTWRFVDSFYSLNMSLYNSFDQVNFILSSLLLLTLHCSNWLNIV